MDDKEWLAQRFEEDRPRLRAVAYRMLGSLAEADDAVQDTWERVSRAGADEVENMSGWLTTILARVCLNDAAAAGGCGSADGSRRSVWELLPNSS